MLDFCQQRIEIQISKEVYTRSSRKSRKFEEVPKRIYESHWWQCIDKITKIVLENVSKFILAKSEKIKSKAKYEKKNQQIKHCV